MDRTHSDRCGKYSAKRGWHATPCYSGRRILYANVSALAIPHLRIAPNTLHPSVSVLLRQDGHLPLLECQLLNKFEIERNCLRKVCTWDCICAIIFSTTTYRSHRGMVGHEKQMGIAWGAEHTFRASKDSGFQSEATWLHISSRMNFCSGKQRYPCGVWMSQYFLAFTCYVFLT